MSQHHGSSGDPDDDMEHRQALADSSLAQLFEAFDEGLEQGLEDPVVVLLDCEDEIGGEIARDWASDEEVDRAIAEQQQSPSDDMVVTLAMALDFEECQEMMPDIFPYVAETFAEPPPLDGFLAVVVARGGAATFTVPFDARP